MISVAEAVGRIEAAAIVAAHLGASAVIAAKINTGAVTQAKLDPAMLIATGTATLAAATGIVISTASIGAKASGRVVHVYHTSTPPAARGGLYVSNLVSNTSFRIVSTNAADVSKVAWAIWKLT